jgi:F1F0 ATPase subunit 2
MMSETLGVLLASAGGGALGAIFFGGLWWTVRRGLLSTRPALWFVGSMVARTGIVLAGFYFVVVHGWHRLVPCFFGFVMARPALTWLVRRPVTGDPECN